MNNQTTNEEYIAGNKTRNDWKIFRKQLENGGTSELWNKAYNEYFLVRLNLRYLDPIKVLQANGTFQGEGFSIMAILCSLIEFLESTRQGKIYKYVRDPQQLGSNEYCSSKAMFTAFLTQRQPFCNAFTAKLALIFYESIRCGLLHEASTKNGWRIWAKSPSGLTIIDDKEKILFRDDFENGVTTYVEGYGKELTKSKALQEAFIRKISSL